MSPRRRFAFAVRAGLLLLLVAGGLAVPDAEAQPTVRVPDTTIAPSETVQVPIRADGLAGREVLSWQFDLRYDPAVLDTVTVGARGTLAEGRRMTANTTRPGRLSVAVAGTAPVTSGGRLVVLRLRGGRAGTTAVAWEAMQFNEGPPAARTHDGEVVVASDTSGAPR